MSCLVYDNQTDVATWLYSNGIYSRFIHKSVNTIIEFAKSNKIEYSLGIADIVQITTGVPLLTRFDIYADKIQSYTLGTLKRAIDGWEAFEKGVSAEFILAEAIKEDMNTMKSSVFTDKTKQDSH